MLVQLAELQSLRLHLWARLTLKNVILAFSMTRLVARGRAGAKTLLVEAQHPRRTQHSPLGHCGELAESLRRACGDFPDWE